MLNSMEQFFLLIFNSTIFCWLYIKLIRDLYFFIKKMLIKYKQISCFYNFLFVCVTFFSFFVLPTFSQNNDLINLVKKCFKKSDLYLCQLALKQINTLQVKSANLKDYSCQTLLLGVEANIILSMNKKSSKYQRYSMLDQVKGSCVEKYYK